MASAKRAVIKDGNIYVTSNCSIYEGSTKFNVAADGVHAPQYIEVGEDTDILGSDNKCILQTSTNSFICREIIEE